jgi:hypothetical protein
MALLELGLDTSVRRLHIFAKFHHDEIGFFTECLLTSHTLSSLRSRMMTTHSANKPTYKELFLFLSVAGEKDEGVWDW